MDEGPFSEWCPRTLRHRGYVGGAIWDEESGIFHGRVINLGRDMVTFESRTIDLLDFEFRRSVECYLEGNEVEIPHSEPEVPLGTRLLYDLHPSRGEMEFYDPHPGLMGCLMRLPMATQLCVASMAGTVGAIPDAMALIWAGFRRELHIGRSQGDIQDHPKSGFISLSLNGSDGSRNSWRVIRYRPIKT